VTTESIPGTVLYERFMPAGPAVRIRRTSGDGDTPVVAVLEVDRRALTPRASRGLGVPPSLLLVEGTTDRDVVTMLKPHADNDATVSRLMIEKGLR
jgi:hypothetical protein